MKFVQTMLGNQSATMTLDPYSHLLADLLDELADAIDAARASSVIAISRSGTVTPLPPAAQADRGTT